MKRTYGWKRQSLDLRDKIFAPKFARDVELPLTVDLSVSPFMPPVYDQGSIGSCTANAWAAAYAYERAKQGFPPLATSGNPSRLFIYWNERAMESTPGNDLTQQDSGAEVRDGVKSLASLGVCDESLWPYDEGNGLAMIQTKPSDVAFAAAKNDLAIQYLSVNQDEISMMSCLAQGFPIVIGFMVYPEFESDWTAATGKLTMPTFAENLGWQKPVGGHCVLIAGFNKNNRTWLVRNSWGESWGNKGYFTAPFDYFTNPKLASDFWCLQAVT